MTIAPIRIEYRHLMRSLWRAYPRFVGTSLRTLDLDCQTINFDLRCISWILQTSLDQAAHLSAFEHLALLSELAHFHSNVVDCFNIFVRCISISKNKVAIIPGLEQLATASANSFFGTLHQIATIGPTSIVLADVKRRYNQVFPSELDFAGLQFYPTVIKFHALVDRFGTPRDIQGLTADCPFRNTFHSHDVWLRTPMNNINGPNKKSATLPGSRVFSICCRRLSDNCRD